MSSVFISDVVDTRVRHLEMTLIILVTYTGCMDILPCFCIAFGSSIEASR